MSMDPWTVLERERGRARTFRLTLVIIGLAGLAWVVARSVA